MEELCSLLDMRWRLSIFVWEVSCKSSRSFGIGRFHFFYILRLRLPSFLLANICIVCLQFPPVPGCLEEAPYGIL
ncbi:hypothetical protein L3X38_021087 [Prunus dulcis]|uniref:Uncharacterized protein n=1 Tax=Prunus dulcis TaxID=3755 RepID=A0AAD4VVW8_PRUDU|nr:hypothetical protein L3X38_021087 [Prunus dulcis]